MQVRRIFGLWAALLTLAWGITTWLGSAALPADTGALWWQLRRHGLYLTGVWSIGMMSLVMLLALRQPWQDRLLGGHGSGLSPAQVGRHCCRCDSHHALGHQGIHGRLGQ